jgi:hypothetical protein
MPYLPSAGGQSLFTAEYCGGVRNTSPFLEYPFMHRRSLHHLMIVCRLDAGLTVQKESR